MHDIIGHSIWHIIRVRSEPLKVDDIFPNRKCFLISGFIDPSLPRQDYLAIEAKLNSGGAQSNSSFRQMWLSPSMVDISVHIYIYIYSWEIIITPGLFV